MPLREVSLEKPLKYTFFQWMSDLVGQLRILGRDLAHTFINRLPREFTKVCFICVNTYRSYRQAIGVTPIGDAVSLAKCAKYFEYEVFYVHNPHAQNFMDYLNYFLEHATKHLIVYYVGQGTTQQDLDRTIPRTADDAFSFDDAAVEDIEFLDSLTIAKNPSNRVTLITDTCRPDTAWNITSTEMKGRNLPPGILTLSAQPTAATSKQMMARCQSQGIFTFNLTKQLKANPKITPEELAAKMAEPMAEFAQVFTVGATSPDSITEPILE
jgi:hypothetical protein